MRPKMRGQRLKNNRKKDIAFGKCLILDDFGTPQNPKKIPLTTAVSVSGRLIHPRFLTGILIRVAAKMREG
jgi:hypothetical protein